MNLCHGLKAEIFGMSPEDTEVPCAEEAPPYNRLTDNEKRSALFTDGSCCTVGKL